MSININIISVKEINIFDKYNNVNTFSVVILKSMCYANHLLSHYTLFVFCPNYIYSYTALMTHRVDASLNTNQSTNQPTKQPTNSLLVKTIIKNASWEFTSVHVNVEAFALRSMSAPKHKQTENDPNQVWLWDWL